ncbi:glutathione S-transferase family protein [Aquitalea sp. USM4]|uniref:glutathione S-transferase family protein n=1 Tax=Aquitalea sp. USM4 TaxID=1590041 RepID=UPI00103EA67F|nr:glutathione S-transferase family protein [Aquitalea sp. USM4]QBJ79473.1 glutathione S-transferase family protein [Aquitalea sp. USM4]
MRLYYHPLSSCSRRVLLVARQLGLPLELIQVDLFRGEQNTPAFLQLNPNHQVPVLEDNGHVLWESYAIMQYLAELAPDQSLHAASARERADASRWMFWCAQHWMPPISSLNWENAIKQMAGQGPASAVEVERAEAGFVAAGQILDQHLAGREWICGQQPSLADLAIAAPLADWQQARLPLKEFGEIVRWFGQIQALDCWQQTGHITSVQAD